MTVIELIRNLLVDVNTNKPINPNMKVRVWTDKFEEECILSIYEDDGELNIDLGEDE